MKAIGFKVLVKVLDDESRPVERINGLVIDTGEYKYDVGEIISHGEKCTLEYPGITDGDKIYFQKGAGIMVKEGDQKFRVINISDILVVCQK